MEHLIHDVLKALGEDPQRKGLQKTPARVAKAFADLTKGYHMNVSTLLGHAVFDTDRNDMVVISDIEFYSLCEHHMIPSDDATSDIFREKKMIGLSKLPRIVEMYSRRLQVQERLTAEIAEAIEEVLHPLGVGVVIEAQHLCMMMRGVEKQRAKTITSTMLGAFREEHKTRAEFLNLIHRE